jgi:uncharacterized protein YjbI with pentapeptide repeats
MEAMAAERPVHLAFYVFLAVAAVVVPLSLPFYLYDTGGFLENLAAEAHGMVFDLLVIGWFIFWLRQQGERRLRANRYREEIEDFLGWRAPEAALRLAGNVRRLNRLGDRSPLKLTEAFLQGVNLAGADLGEADLWGADLTGAALQGARLDGANLAGARLQGADLERATLAKADLRGADLTEADLERAFFEHADLRAANLVAADLQFASLPHADLRHARFLGANLRGAHLEGADLRQAVLQGANLHGASLDRADLRGADLTRADLARADLTGARLPDGDALLAFFDDVRTLEAAKLDDAVETALRAAHPRLFGPAEKAGADA